MSPKILTATQNSSSWSLEDGTYLAPSSAAAREVLAQVHSHALANRIPFPLQVRIQPTGKQPIMLQVNYNMTTSLIPATSSEVPTDSAPASQGEDPADESSTGTKKRRGLLVAAATLAGITIAALAVSMSLNSTSSQETAPPSPATPSLQSTEEAPIHTITDHEQILALAGDTLYTTDGAQLIATDLATGTIKKHPATFDPAKTRTITSGDTTAIDGGEGTVYLATGTQEPRTIPGTLNARGTAPIVLEGNHYTTATGEGTIPDNASILGATDTNVLIVKAPAILEYTGDGRSITISGPTETAHLTSWIAGTDTRAVTTWQDGDHHWLILTDTTGDGTTILTQEIPNLEAIKFSKGNITLGETQALINDHIQEICPTGKWIGTERWCPTDTGQWTYETTTLPTEPQASTTTYIITNNQVKER